VVRSGASAHGHCREPVRAHIHVHVAVETKHTVSTYCTPSSPTGRDAVAGHPPSSQQPPCRPHALDARAAAEAAAITVLIDDLWWAARRSPPRRALSSCISFLWFSYSRPRLSLRLLFGQVEQSARHCACFQALMTSRCSLRRSVHVFGVRPNDLGQLFLMLSGSLVGSLV